MKVKFCHLYCVKHIDIVMTVIKHGLCDVREGTKRDLMASSPRSWALTPCRVEYPYIILTTKT